MIAAILKAQPTWRFHVAFEDFSGAMDTIWLIYDSNATSMVDTLLGEGPVQFDYSRFNVFIYNSDGDSTKTTARSYAGFPVHQANVRAFNAQYPMTISWDTALFKSSVLPIQPNLFFNVAFMNNEYFNFVNNDPVMEAFNMLIDNFAIAATFTWGSREHFPLLIGFEYNPALGVNKFFRDDEKSVYPNPSHSFIKITTEESLKSLLIFDLSGRLVRDVQIENKTNLVNHTIDVSSFAEGTYFLSFIYFDNSHSAKLISIVK